MPFRCRRRGRRPCAPSRAAARPPRGWSGRRAWRLQTACFFLNRFAGPAKAPAPPSPRPDLAGHLDAARQLPPLVVLPQLVAVGGRGEAALVTERALLERHKLRRLVDALLEGLLALDLGPLGAHQAEHHALASRHEEIGRAHV